MHQSGPLLTRGGPGMPDDWRKQGCWRKRPSLAALLAFGNYQDMDVASMRRQWRHLDDFCCVGGVQREILMGTMAEAVSA